MFIRSLAAHFLFGVVVANVLGSYSIHVDGSRVHDELRPHTVRSVERFRMRDSIILSAITTDTGPFRPGNRNFARFVVPGHCLAAAQNTRMLASRSLVAQTEPLAIDSLITGDTLPTETVRVARTCAARFTVAGTAAADLSDLFAVALMAGNDSMARAIVTRRVALAPDVTGRIANIRDAIEGYLQAEPRRLSPVLTLLAQIDSIGAPIDGIRATSKLLEAATASFDERYMRLAAERIIGLGQTVIRRAEPIQEWDFRIVLNAYQALGQIAYVEHPDSVLSIMARAKTDLSRFIPLGQFRPQVAPERFRAYSVPQVRNQLLAFNGAQYVSAPLPPINAAYWRPSAPRTWPPGQGAATLVVYGGTLANRCAREDGIWAALWGGVYGCRDLYAQWPLWVKHYGARLMLIVVAQTEGNAARSNQLSPSQEADSLAWFFRDHLKLPVTVGLVQDSIWWRPAIDGRQGYVDTSAYGRLMGGNGSSGNELVLFYDTHGKLLYADKGRGPFLRKLVDQTLSGGTVKPVPSMP